MTVSVTTGKPARALCAALLCAGLAGCASTVSTSSFKGEPHAIAQRIASLQSDATSSEQRKICANDLASTVVSRLGGKAACEQAIKNQLTEIDSLEVSVRSITVAPGGATATASVQSTYGGKKRITTLHLVKENGSWKVSAV